MKSRLLFSIAFILMATLQSFILSAQNLPTVGLPENISLHFLSPEPIQYVDISTKSIVGDIPIKNVLRIKRLPDSLRKGDTADAVLTIAGESFIAQFKVKYIPFIPGYEYEPKIEILPEHTRPLETSGQGFSQNQFRSYAAQLLFKKQDHDIASTKAYGINGNIGHLATLGDYIFIDVTYTNNTNLKYDTDELRFKIEDEKINKATTVQAVEIKPEFTLFKNNTFRKNFRNIYVFKKFSFPGHKVLNIELNEKQISGRVINLKIKYKELMEADTL
jgi:conjugative transposon TraN protein